MTCIVAVVNDDGDMFMGSDSLSSGEKKCRVVTNRKVFKSGEFLIGYTTSWRMGQLLEFSFNIPPLDPETQDIMAYMVNKFVPAVIDLFIKGNFGNQEHTVKVGGSFLVIVRSIIFEIQDDFSVLQIHSNYASVGSGAEVAMGALAALNQDREHSTYATCVAALEIASKHVVSVGGKPRIISLINEHSEVKTFT
ncbi:hypothetical protein ACE1OE_12365 [Vibrio sp. E150_011]